MHDGKRRSRRGPPFPDHHLRALQDAGLARIIEENPGLSLNELARLSGLNKADIPAALRRASTWRCTIANLSPRQSPIQARVKSARRSYHLMSHHPENSEAYYPEYFGVVPDDSADFEGDVMGPAVIRSLRLLIEIDKKWLAEAVLNDNQAMAERHRDLINQTEAFIALTLKRGRFAKKIHDANPGIKASELHRRIKEAEAEGSLG